MDIFDKLADKIKKQKSRLISSLKEYFRRLLFPLYLFPIKLVTYSFYYSVKFAIKLIIAFVSLIFETIVYPFRSLKHFFKAIVFVGIGLYLFASLIVIGDYLTKQYGWWGKFFCSVGVRDRLQNSVVRIVGGYSEGSGFFIAEDQVLTNFHVIADEPSPKIIFPDESFVTPTKILGNSGADLATLYTKEKYPEMVFPLPDRVEIYEDEPLLALGYPLGTGLSGKATIMKGNFSDYRSSKRVPMSYVQTNINLVEGMSGGPLVDQCGELVGVNTLSLSGLSLFIPADQVKQLIPNFTDEEIAKIEVDPSLSPEDAVVAFYTYLKARRMEDGFALLSSLYLKKTNFEEWTNRFRDILDVDVFKAERYKNTNDTVFVKFSTKNWNDGEVDYHYFEGTWQTVKEDGVYKMNKSNIKEVYNPSWEWFNE